MDPYTPLETASNTSRYFFGSLVLDVAGFEDLNQSIAVQANGKILVAGFSFYGGPIETSYDYSVIRLTAAGLPDSSFGVDGRVVIGAQVSIDEGWSMAVQPDGAVLVQSPYGNAGLTSFGLTRLKLDGSADTAFNANAAASIPAGIRGDGGNLTVNRDGSILFSRSDSDGAVLVQLNADGTLDTSFGTQGVARLASGLDFDGEIHAVEQANGQFVLAGALDTGDGYQYAVVRVNADGSLDSRFGDGGKVLFPTHVLSDPRGDLALQPDGKIVLAGSNDTYQDFQVVRLNTDGSYDLGFGTAGVASIDTQAAYDSARSVTVLANGNILVTGNSDMGNGETIDYHGDIGIVRLRPDGSLDTSFGSEQDITLDGSNNDDVLQGLDIAEYLDGYGGDDVYQGNGGRDFLYDGAGADVFRFVSVDDSYRTADRAFSDTLIFFDPSEDRIDLMDLGFSGFGNGHNGTLAIALNAAGNQTFLKSYDYDENGHRFELAINGNFLGRLDASNVLLSAVAIDGTAGKDTLTGSAVQEVLSGLAGNDRLDGGADDDVLIGGSGRDVLTGGSGDDIFRFSQASDSYRTATTSFADLITDFQTYHDKIDVSALGYTGLGDGTDGTLLLVESNSIDRTYLKDLEPDGQGHRFELSLAGSYGFDLRDSDFIFATSAKTATVPAAEAGHADVAEIVAVGVAPLEGQTALG
jgi:serralysin